MLLVQQYLQTKSFGELAKEHGVYASFSKSGHKWSLNYDQIEAKESDPLAQECRGLILACEDGRVLRPEVNGLQLPADNIVPGKTRVIAYPMRRFFNHGQGSAAQINWSDPNLAVLEKLDGTLCIVYHDPFIDQWCVATRSVPEADLLMDNGIFTFRTLFEKALVETTGKSFVDYTAKLDHEVTYCFELTTPYNRIVVEYKSCGITLLAARSVLYETDQYGLKCVSLEEIGLSDVESYGVPFVQAHTYTHLEDLLDWVSSLNPMEHEGVVVRDGNFNRIKVKNAAYVAASKIRDRMASSARNCVELILLEKDDDAMPLLPEEIANNLRSIKAGLQQVIRQYDNMYQQALKQAYICSLCGYGTQLVDHNSTKCSQCGYVNVNLKKTFALLVAQDKNLWSAPFFHMFGGKSNSMKDFILKGKKEGTWPDGFLDKLLELVNNANS